MGADLVAIATSAVNDAVEEGTIESSGEINSPLPAAETAVVEAAPVAAVVDPAAAVVPVETPVVPVVPVAETPEEKAFREEVGVSEKRSDGKENRIPYSNVKKIVANQRAKAVEETLNPIAEMLGVKATEYKPEVLKTRLDEGAAAITRVQTMAPLTEIMETNPARFMEMLAKAIPGYEVYYNAVKNGGAAAAAAEVKPVVPETPDPMPTEDYPIKDANGVVTGYTYSIDGLNKRLAWERRNASKEAVAEARKLMDEKFKPIEDQRTKDANDAAQREAALNLKASIDAQLAQAATWEGWAENKDAILQVLVDDKAAAERTGSKMKHNLESAYRTVMFPKLKAAGELTAAERAKIAAEARKAALDEISKAPTSTSTVVSTHVKPVTEHAGPRRLEDVARDAVAAAGLLDK